jgi:hypothetical protein
MENKNRFVGCFASGPSLNYDDDKATKDLAGEQGRIFREYLWGEMGISDSLAILQSEKYGMDLALILFQFYLNPLPFELQHLKEIESYRKKERAIGIPIIVTSDVFFRKDENGRFLFLKQAILNKLDLLAEVVKKKKLDTNIDLLRTDMQKILAGSVR